MTEWKRCRPWLEASLKTFGGTHAIGDIEEALRQNRMAFVAGAKSAMVLEVRFFPKFKALYVFLIGGELADIKTLAALTLQTAKDAGCACIMSCGRPGWSRVLPHDRSWPIYVKDIALDKLEWERAKPMIEAALEYTGGTHSIEDIERGLEANKMALLMADNSAIVCEVHEYPQLKSLHLFLAGGDLTELKAMNERIARAAKLLGCSRITIAGRKGWGPALKELGYEPRWLCLSKDVANG